MKIKIDRFDVVLDVSIDNHSTIDDTEITPEYQFLNLLSILASEASESVARNGYEALADSYKKISNNIYDYLKEQGVYNNVNKG